MKYNSRIKAIYQYRTFNNAKFFHEVHPQRETKSLYNQRTYGRRRMKSLQSSGLHSLDTTVIKPNAVPTHAHDTARDETAINHFQCNGCDVDIDRATEA